MTPEEHAERDVKVIDIGTIQKSTFRVQIGDYYTIYSTRVLAEWKACLLRREVAQVVRTAVDEALSSHLPGVPLCDGELAGIKGRVEAALPGPWVWDTIPGGNGNNRWCWTNDVGMDSDRQVCEEIGDDDTAMFISHSRSDVHRLIQHIEYLEGLIRDLSVDGQVEVYRRGYADGIFSSQEDVAGRVLNQLRGMSANERVELLADLKSEFCERCGVARHSRNSVCRTPGCGRDEW